LYLDPEHLEGRRCAAAPLLNPRRRFVVLERASGKLGAASQCSEEPFRFHRNLPERTKALRRLGSAFGKLGAALSFPEARRGSTTDRSGAPLELCGKAKRLWRFRSGFAALENASVARRRS
jgi:hypothetical protein